MHRRAVFVSLALVAPLVWSLAAGCGDDEKTGEAADGETDVAAPDGSDDSAADSEAPDTAPAPADTAPPDDSPLGGDRPAELVLPPGYSPGGEPRPLLILLHGYTASGPIQDLYLGLSPAAAAMGFITLIPNGTRNQVGLQFWNAAPAWCCDFGRSEVDDAGYLLSLVDEASLRFTIDPARIYLMGHSNGGFMAYKMACEHADRFAAIASIAGGMAADEAACAPSEPVGILELHGTLDPLVLYGGVSGLYPGVDEVMRRWAAHDGCELLPAPKPGVDYDNGVIGAETVPEPYPGCAGGGLELWRMRGSGHVPLFTDAVMPAVLDWLLAHAKAP